MNTNEDRVVIGALVLLFILGKVSLLVLLITLSALLAFAILECSEHGHGELTNRAEKG